MTPRKIYYFRVIKQEEKHVYRRVANTSERVVSVIVFYEPKKIQHKISFYNS